jgi:hypothetical protein
MVVGDDIIIVATFSSEIILVNILLDITLSEINATFGNARLSTSNYGISN